MMQAISDDLSHARAAFEAWRAEHGRGRIPEHLWGLALALLDRHQAAFVARQLGLSQGRLRIKHAELKARRATPPKETSARFLELHPSAVLPLPPPVNEMAPVLQVQIERPDGVRLTLSIPAHQTSALDAVCAAFLRITS